VGNRAVDIQHGTGVEASSHPDTKGTTNGIFLYYHTCVVPFLYAVDMLLALFIFFSSAG
jgi:hypothetical protein